MDAISIRQARESADIVRRSLALDGAVVEICAYPEVREETVQMVEPQSVLMLGLSRLLTGSEGRKAGDPRRPFARMGALALRPAGVPMEFHVAQGAFDTIRIRFDDRQIAPALMGINFDDTTLSACFDMHAPTIEEAMLRLAAEVESPGEDSGDVGEALVRLILLDLRRFLAQAAERAGRRRGGLSARALRVALAMIDAPSPAPSIDAMAERCGISRDHFIRCFHHSTGISPGAAIRRRRIDRAKAMLTEDQGSIEEIARALGYAGAPSFTAAFRRETGRPPGAWRALMR